jgi:hypothetical protein
MKTHVCLKLEFLSCTLVRWFEICQRGHLVNVIYLTILVIVTKKTGGRMRKFFGLTIVLVFILTSQVVHASVPKDFQDLGTEYQTANNLHTVVVSTLEYKDNKWGHWLSATWYYDNYSKRSVKVKGTFSLHFESGKPVRLPRGVFRNEIVQSRSTYTSNWTWEFSPNRKPIYLQWNPTSKILGPSANALRWQLPPFGKARVCYFISEDIPCKLEEY